jgi:fluoroacetyl-CoA thioesterase
MRDAPKIGTTHVREFRVAAGNCIDFEGVTVLSSHHLIWELEHAALELLRSGLEPHEISLGTFLELEHQSAAVAGDDVLCLARVVHVAGAVVTFRIVATCRDVPLAQGLHKRRVVERQRMLERLAARGSPPPSDSPRG